VLFWIEWVGLVQLSRVTKKAVLLRASIIERWITTVLLLNL
jgi:hypothetical protein